MLSKSLAIAIGLAFGSAVPGPSAKAAVPPSHQSFEYRGTRLTVPFHWSTSAETPAQPRFACSVPGGQWIDTSDANIFAASWGVLILEDFAWTTDDDGLRGSACDLPEGQSVVEALTGFIGIDASTYRLGNGPLAEATKNAARTLTQAYGATEGVSIQVDGSVFVMPFVADGTARDVTFIAFTTLTDFDGVDDRLHNTFFLVALTTPSGVEPLAEPTIRDVLESLDVSEAWLRERRRLEERNQTMIRPPESERPAPVSGLIAGRDALLQAWDQSLGPTGNSQ